MLKNQFPSCHKPEQSIRLFFTVEMIYKKRIHTIHADLPPSKRDICQRNNDVKFIKVDAALHPIPVKSKVWYQVYTVTVDLSILG